MYANDDYAGMSIGKLDFYYGYEVTKCLKRPKKTEEWCDENDCENREWCFVVSSGDKRLWIVSESELKKKNPNDDLYDPLRSLVAGIENYFKEHSHVCSLHLIEDVAKN